MPVVRTYECPDCGGSFQHLHLKREEPPPDSCKLCHATFDEVPSPLPSGPRILTNLGKSHDQVYRAMEETSRNRAELAYQVGGGDRSEYDAMHVTDMKDNVREGDIAAITPPSPVQRALEAQARTGNVGHTSGPMQQYGDLLKQGPAAGSNAMPMLDKVRAAHPYKRHQIESTGEVARYMGDK